MNLKATFSRRGSQHVLTIPFLEMEFASAPGGTRKSLLDGLADVLRQHHSSDKIKVRIVGVNGDDVVLNIDGIHLPFPVTVRRTLGMYRRRERLVDLVDDPDEVEVEEFVRVMDQISPRFEALPSRSK